MQRMWASSITVACGLVVGSRVSQYAKDVGKFNNCSLWTSSR